jgi:hypothetical protein
MYPESFKMRHDPFLSAARGSQVDKQELRPAGDTQRWHRLRANLTPEDIELPSCEQLHRYTSDDELVASDPLAYHPFVRSAVEQGR